MIDNATRETYKMTCRQRRKDGTCAKRQALASSVHLSLHCDGKCQRMFNYDKKHTNNG
jgi:hypothetical protein